MNTKKELLRLRKEELEKYPESASDLYREVRRHLRMLKGVSLDRALADKYFSYCPLSTEASLAVYTVLEGSFSNESGNFRGIHLANAISEFILLMEMTDEKGRAQVMEDETR